MRTISPEQFKKIYGEQAYQRLTGLSEQPKTPSYGERVIGMARTNLEQRSKNINEIQGRNINPFLKGYETVGQGAGFAAETLENIVSEVPGIKQALSPVGKAVQWAIQPGQPAIQKFSQGYNQLKPDIKGTLEATGNLARLGTDVNIATQGTKLAIEGGKKVVQGTKDLATSLEGGVEKGLEGSKQLAIKGKEALAKPKPTAEEAMGEVLQGKTKDVKSGFEALKNVDTSGVKTYEELAGKIDDSIKDLSGKVDEVLDNTQPIKLSELKVTGKSTGGKVIKTDHISRALENLEELYTSIGDDVAAQNIKEVLNKARIAGLTRLEVNNLSRRYGIEFKEKAFNKLGDPLTSVNAIRFENTREGLKTIARQGLGGKEAQAMDRSISSLYRVQGLIKKNVEAVNKLSQKVQERGLLEKIGYHAAKTTDILTGGTIRGIMGGILPRGVGYKVMNALDLEEVLERNLRIIQKYFNASDSQTIKLLKIAAKAASKTTK